MGARTLEVHALGLTFRNPIVLAAGTAGYGRELREVVRLERLGGLVTKAVNPEPRAGAPAPRVAEFDGGMINAVGLANPGLAAVRDEHLPWLARELPEVRARESHVDRAVEHVDESPAAGADLRRLGLAARRARMDLVGAAGPRFDGLHGRTWYPFALDCAPGGSVLASPHG